MDYEAKKARFEAARARSGKSREEAEAYRRVISDLYGSVHGEEPDIHSEADRKGLKVLIDLVKANSSAEGAEVVVPTDLVDRLTRGFRRSVSMFDVARTLVNGFPQPLSDRRYVWVSTGGQVYHRYQDCPGLIEGKEKAGRDAAIGLRRMMVEMAKTAPGYMVAKRRACKICLP